jgi:proteasome assembly chaperone (PAC2) family protein
VYCVGNQKEAVSDAVTAGANNEVYGIVGPIIGVSGLLLGLAKNKNLSAMALLTETMGHPMYLGLRGAKATLNVLFSLFSCSFDLSTLDDEIRQVEDEPPTPRPRIDAINKLKRFQDTNYIG